MNFTNILESVRQSKPLVQCITNFVTVNDCANIILASGGNPTMAHDLREVEDAVCNVQALVCNLGAVEDWQAMALAAKKANQQNKPVIFDPVGAGSTQLRRSFSKDLLQQADFSVIRGNASEIRFLAGFQSSGIGVDAAQEDTVSESNLAVSVKMAKSLAQQTKAVIAISGVWDLVSDGVQTMVLKNGCATMSRITGSGCMLTALIGAFCGAVPNHIFDATCAAVAAMGMSGEIAEQKRLQNGTGNATFRTDLIDAMFNLTPQQLTEGVRYEIFN